MEEQLTIFDLCRPKERLVEEIDKTRAKNFIEKIHYSRLMPQNTIRTFGLFENGELIGVVAYGIPPSPSLCIGVAGIKNRYRVVE